MATIQHFLRSEYPESGYSVVSAKPQLVRVSRAGRHPQKNSSATGGRGAARLAATGTAFAVWWGVQK